MQIKTTGVTVRSCLSKHAVAVLFAVALAVAAASAQKPGEVEIRQGVIEQITNTQIAGNHHRGVGAVVGGLAGLGIGSLIGSPTGPDVAMVVGTIGGALAGNEVQKKHDQPLPAQHTVVRVKSGVLVSSWSPSLSRSTGG